MSQALDPSFGRILIGEGAPPPPAELMRQLAADGAVLLRGFDLDADSFVAYSDACCARFSRYVGGGFRFRALDRETLGAGGTLLSTTGGTQSFSIPLHGEMYYLRRRPDVLWFFCETPPAEKGQTTLADGRTILARLPEASRRWWREVRLRYVRELAEQDWRTTFCTDDLDEVRRLCDENDMELDVLPDRSLRTAYVAPAVHADPDGAEVFINSALMLADFELSFAARAESLGAGGMRMPLVVRQADGAPIPAALVAELDDACSDLQVSVRWQRGDVVLVDNRRVLHGRRRTVGTDRKILVRLGHLDA